MIEILPGIIGAVTAIGLLHYSKKNTPKASKKIAHYTSDSETSHRLYTLLDFIEQEVPFDGRTEYIRARKIHTETGARYQFYYKNRENPFIILTYERKTHIVHKTHIYKNLWEEKEKLKHVIQILIKKIQEEQRPKVTIDQRINKLLNKLNSIERSGFSPKINRLKEELKVIADTYRSLQPETKKEYEDMVQVKLDTIVENIQQMAREAEQRKVELLQKKLARVERLLERTEEKEETT